jgi:Zn-dependent protease
LLGQTPALLIASLIAVGIGMTFHEFAHNYIGYRMGDPEPRRLGRLTLNPLVHINWIGWLMFALIGFGILGSAPISWTRMPRENRRWRWLAAVAAGPLANLLIAVVFALVLRLIFAFGIYSRVDLALALSSNLDLARLPLLIIFMTIQFNIVLFFFNLLPLFPIDGWQIVWALLPPDLAYQWERYQQITSYIFFALLLLSIIGIFPIFGILIGQPSAALRSLLTGI